MKERELWLCVILQAKKDYQTITKNGRELPLTYFDSEDFRTVCAYAGVSHREVIKQLDKPIPAAV